MSVVPPSLDHTALVVDDNDDNLGVFELALTHAGYLVALAEDGEVGLDKLQNQQFDLLILDLHLPGIQGNQILERVKSHPLYREVKVVVVTANPNMVTEQVENLADHVFFKPIDIVNFSDFAHSLRFA